MRAARPAGAAVRRGRRRPAPAAGSRARADGHVHDHDRRHRQRGRRRRARLRPAARPRRGGAARVGHGADRAGPRRRRGGAHVADWRASGWAGRESVRATASPRACSSGAALGFVYTPCAGPILAAVISVSAASGRTVAVAIAYAFGSGAVLLALALGGHRLFDRVRRAGRGPALQRDARRDHGHHGRRDRHRTGRQLRPVRRPAHPRSQPHRVAGEIARRAEPPARAHRPQGEVRGERLIALRAAQRQPGEAAGRRASSESPRRRARIHRNGGLVQHAGRPPAHARGTARARGARRLLDVHVHQLHPHAPLPEGVGRRLPPRRPDDRRRRDARVLLRARRGQRRQRDRAVRHPLPRRPGQRNGHLERLRQRVLARRLPDRRPRPGALRRLRRGRLRRDRDRDPRAVWPNPARRSAG